MILVRVIQLNMQRTITVATFHCIQGRLLATLALLNGANAEAFLQQQAVKYWVSK